MIWLYKLIHFTLGFIAGVTGVRKQIDSLAIVILFLAYEEREYQVIHDRDYISIAEFTAGYVAGLLSLQAIKYLWRRRKRRE